MNKLLLVDDDAVLMRSYQGRLSAHGFQVNTAASGSAAIAMLGSAKPDAVVLDLMMPDLSGVDVLKFIRSQPRLAATPVVVLTNSYLNDWGRQAAAIGIQKAMLKAQCSPSVLMACVDEMLRARKVPSQPPQMPAPSTTLANTPAAGVPLTAYHTRSETPSAARPQAPATAAQSAPVRGPNSRQVPGAKAGTDLLVHAPAICADLRQLFLAVAQQPPAAPEQPTPLRDLHHRVHSLVGAACLTEYVRLTQTAAVFEAFLQVLMNSPSRIGPSALRTIAHLVDSVELLFRHAREPLAARPLSVQVLVVDDDPLAGRLAVSALREAKLTPCSTEDPVVAWQWANAQHFDLILLDVEMPVLNGFELCKRLRGVPGCERTPVIFVSAHSDFETRAKSSLSGGDDLIAKPILPVELAAKAVMHLLGRQMLS